MSNNDVKINIYLKGREKPITFHDKTAEDDTFKEKVSYFFDMLTKKKKGVAVIDFTDDNIIIPMEEIDVVVVTKPRLDDSTTIIADEESDEKDTGLNMMSDEDDLSNEDNIAETTENSIEVID